ncbi:hypothetical protein ACP4OV_024869 [Aristida adscensionis]
MPISLLLAVGAGAGEDAAAAEAEARRRRRRHRHRLGPARAPVRDPEPRCSSLPLTPSSGRSRRWRRLGDAAMCCASAQLGAEGMQWISVAATGILMVARGSCIHKSFLAPFFALQAPSRAISWIKGDYGQWTAFLLLLMRLLYFIPGELELPLSAMLLVLIAPYQFMNLRCSRRGGRLEEGLWP